MPSLNFRGGNELRNGGVERGKALSRQYINQHYHQPSDEVTDAWQFDGLTEDAQFGFYAGNILAPSPRRDLKKKFVKKKLRVKLMQTKERVFEVFI